MRERPSGESSAPVTCGGAKYLAASGLADAACAQTSSAAPATELANTVLRVMYQGFELTLMAFVSL